MLGDLELRLHAGQRTAELVGGVGDERPLPLPTGGQPVEHVVQGDRQGPDLVGGLRYGQPIGAVGAGQGRVADLLRPGPQLLDRSQASSRSPARRSPPDPPTSTGKVISSAFRSARRVASTSPYGSAAITLTGSAAGPAATARTRSGPDTPRRTPSITTGSPARAWLSSAGRSSGVIRSAVAEPLTTRCWASTTWTTWAPDVGMRLRQPVLVHHGRDVVGTRQGRVVQGPVDRKGQRAVERQPTDDQGHADPGDPDDHQPGPQAQPPEPPHVTSR